MNIILSRKGFDSSYRGIPSPVIVENGDICNGKIISLPIPLTSGETSSANYNITYDQLKLHGINYFDLIDGLTKKKRKQWITKERLVHLDPDINKEVYKGKRGDD